VAWFRSWWGCQALGCPALDGAGQCAAGAGHSAECPVLGRCLGVGLQCVCGVAELAWPAEGTQSAEAVQFVGLHPVSGIGGARQGGVRDVEPAKCGQRPQPARGWLGGTATLEDGRETKHDRAG
jgi:hypothetical protein